MLHGRVQDSGPTMIEKQKIAMEYAQRVYDGEYDTSGEAVRKANLPVHYKQIDWYLDILRELDWSLVSAPMIA